MDTEVPEKSDGASLALMWPCCRGDRGFHLLQDLFFPTSTDFLWACLWLLLILFFFLNFRNKGYMVKKGIKGEDYKSSGLEKGEAH